MEIGELVDRLISEINTSLVTANELKAMLPPPVTETIINLEPGANVTTALSTLVEGGRIVCAPGSYPAFTINDFPHKSIVIETKNYERSGAIPTLQDKTRMAVFPGMTAKIRSNNVIFKNICFDSNNMDTQCLFGGDQNSMTDISQVPYGFTFDHTMHLGNLSTKRGIAANCKFLLIDNCYFDDFGKSSQDSQAISGWNGCSDHVIINSKLGGVAENVMYGGADHAPFMWPSNIRMVGCELFKKLEWKGKSLNLKCILELKNVIGFHAERCSFHGCWKDAWADGVGIVFKAANQSGGNPEAQSSNVKFINNDVFDVGCYFLIIGRNDGPHLSGICRNIQITNNWLHGMHTDGNGRAFRIGDSPLDLLINHNTIEKNRHSFIELWGYETLTTEFKDNIASHGSYGIHPTIPPGLKVINNGIEKGTGTNVSLNATNKYFPNGSMQSMLNNGEAVGELANITTSDGLKVGFNRN